MVARSNDHQAFKHGYGSIVNSRTVHVDGIVINSCILSSQERGVCSGAVAHVAQGMHRGVRKLNKRTKGKEADDCFHSRNVMVIRNTIVLIYWVSNQKHIL